MCVDGTVGFPHIKTHGCVSAAKKDMQAHQCVIYMTNQVHS